MGAEAQRVSAATKQRVTPAQDDALVRRQLRIVWTTPHGPAGAGGMDRLTQLVIEAHHADPLRCVGITPLTTKGKWGIVVGAFVFALALVRFVLIACRGGVDVLHINVAAYGSAYRKMILALFARRLGVPYVVHVHTGRFATFWKASPVAAAIDRFFARSAAIIVLGRPFAEMVMLRLPQLKAKLHVLANATPSPPAKLRDVSRGAGIHITSLGLLGPNKNTSQLIEALHRLAGRTDWLATIAGDGQVEAARNDVRRLGLADRVFIPGWIDQAAVQELLSRTDIVVLPSLSEGMPMAILEALSHGIPVVATPVGAIPDVISHEGNGLLVPVGDLDALVAALRRLIEDGDLRRSLGAQARRDHAERHTLQAYLERITQIWRCATEQRGTN
jgi:glycosyltransferase involved in cell wall biosynthesis